MALNLPGVPFKLTPEDMGGFDLGQAIKSGLGNYNLFQEAKFKPRNLQEALIKAQQENAISKPYAENAGRAFEADVGAKEDARSLLPLRQQVLQAKAHAYGQPKLTLLEKAQQGYQRAVAQYGENSDQANQAKNYAMRLAQGAAGTQLTIDPETGAVSFSQGGYGKNNQGNNLITDQEGNVISVSKPTTPSSTSLQKASQAEIGRNLIAQKAEMPYLGTGSNASILKDRIAYLAGNKEAGDRLVQAAVAEMLVPEYAGLQLTAQNVPATVTAIEHQQKVIKQGWPKLSDTIVNNLPEELQKEAKLKHAAIIKEIKEAKEVNAAKGFPINIKNSNPNSKKNIDSFVEQMSDQLLPVLPKATPQAIKETAIKRRISPQQVIEELVKKAKEINNQGVQ